MMKRVILIFMVIVVAGAGIYAYRLFTRRVPSLHEVPVDIRVTVAELTTAFENDASSATRRYQGKVILVNGKITGMEISSKTIVLGADSSSSSVRCVLDTSAVDYKQLRAAGLITIKGVCTGFNAGIYGLGSDVVLNRCIILSNK